MRLEGGSTWTRLSAVEAPDHTVIEVYLPPGQGSSAEMVTLSHGVEVVVLAGNVMVEASFGHRPIATGDIARVDRGVPHRFVAPSKKGDCRFLVIVLGRWDGRI
jgi:quercetin dioxygenase-like cupin family protein